MYSDREDGFGNVVEGCWRQRVQGVQNTGSEPQYFSIEATAARNFDADAADARNLFMSYFCSSAGEVSWQWLQPGVSKEIALKRLHQKQLLPLH